MWSWAPHGALLYGIVSGGELVAAAPSGSRRILATGLSTESDAHGSPMVISPSGNVIAVDRSRCGTAVPTGELDLVDARTGARSVPLKRAGEFFTLAGWSSDGAWLLFWAASQCSGSLDADGSPLYAVPAPGGSQVQIVPHMLLFDDFLSWCGRDLIAAAGPDRETNVGSKLVEVTSRVWRRRTIEPAHQLSWVSPSCAPNGRLLAAAAGPNHSPGPFGLEHRSIWLLRVGGRVVRRLTLPPAPDLSDEAPRFSRDGRWIVFVRTQVVPVDSSRDVIELVRASGGPTVPVADFTSDDFSFYDHFRWPYEIAWSDSG